MTSSCAVDKKYNFRVQLSNNQTEKYSITLYMHFDIYIMCILLIRTNYTEVCL